MAEVCFRRVIPALIWAWVGIVLLVVPWRVVQYGYLPPDDALRHAAKAVSGKSWSEILVMRPEITMDHNPGWHWILERLHGVCGWNVADLTLASVVILFLVVASSPLPWFKRPEAWLAALAVLAVIFPYFAARVLVGRPLLLTMSIALMLLSLWARPGMDRPSALTLFSTVFLMALSVWVHGSWYLLVLLPASFLLAQAWRQGAWMSACWAAGTFLGALTTGRPWEFLGQAALIPVLALGQNAPVDSLVGEFQPFSGGYPALLIVGVALFCRRWCGQATTRPWRDPVLWLALLGWALGIKVLRFWLDWGLPALALWLARDLENHLAGRLSRNSWGRLITALVLGAMLVVTFTRDREGRWSQTGAIDPLDADRPEQAAWLPEAGGILYCVDLAVFYETFYRNPTGGWRYILGFEPSFMPPEDLAVYQRLWRTGNAIEACAPWVAKMRSTDRLVLRGGPRPAPNIRGLEWHYASTNTWVGRLPRTAQDDATLERSELDSEATPASSQGRVESPF